MSQRDCKCKNCEKRKKTHNKPVKFESVCVDKLCAKKGHIENLKSENIESKTLILNGLNVGCLLGRSGVSTNKTPYDCMDCNGVPIKPDIIDQDVWDFLTCNRNAYQAQLQQDFLAGREQIRCIKKAYGCPSDCPADCPVPATCEPSFVGSITDDVLTVVSLVPNTGKLGVGYTVYDNQNNVVPDTKILAQLTGVPGETGTYQVDVSQTVAEQQLSASAPCPQLPDCSPIPDECKGDYYMCNLEVPNYLYKTQTLPFYFPTTDNCGSVPTTGFPFSTTRLLSAMSYNLDINNVTCNLATRVASVLIQYAYKGPPPQVPVDPCPTCPGDKQPGLECICVQDPPSEQITCGILRVNCRQFGATININLGENFGNVINIPSEIIQAMIAATPLPLNLNNVIGAFQMAIFLEDGLLVSNNATGSRGGGGGSDSGPSSSNTDGCFNAEAKILMANGEIKQACDIQVGDELASPNGSTKVICRYVQKEGPKQLVKLGDLFISKPHIIMHEGKWVWPIDVPHAEIVDTDIAVYNFITDNRGAIYVENFVASTIGMYCEGAHDMSWPTCQLWASEHIVDLFKLHPQWPSIQFENVDPFLKQLKSVDFAREYISLKNMKPETIPSENFTNLVSVNI